MKQNQIIILFAIIAVVVVVLIVVVAGGGEDGGTVGENVPGGGPGGSGDDVSYWADAPAPAADQETLDRYRNLWPDIDGPKPDRAEVERQWREFAAVYPENVYIPSQFLPELSEEQKQERLETLSAVGAVESQLASSRATARKEAANISDENPPKNLEGPDAPSEPTVSPEQQRMFFAYKIRELESRIQIVEYTLQKGRLDAEQTAGAKEEIAAWKNKIAEYEKVAATIPEE